MKWEKHRMKGLKKQQLRLERLKGKNHKRETNLKTAREEGIVDQHLDGDGWYPEYRRGRLTQTAFAVSLSTGAVRMKVSTCAEKSSSLPAWWTLLLHPVFYLQSFFLSLACCIFGIFHLYTFYLHEKWPWNHRPHLFVLWIPLIPCVYVCVCTSHTIIFKENLADILTCTWEIPGVEWNRVLEYWPMTLIGAGIMATELEVFDLRIWI